MTGLITLTISLSLALLTMSTIVDSRDCKKDGGSCNSDNDCNSGICKGQICQKRTRGIFDDESLIIIDDMVFSEEQLRSGIIGENYRWPNRVLPYEIDPAFTPEELKIINQGFDELNLKTCLRFIPRTNEKDWVYYNRGNGTGVCNSRVGRQETGKQILNLGAPIKPTDGHCIFVHTVIHETIHALGFYHEQSRYDRDDYVTINWDNIPCKNVHNFLKYTDKKVNTLGIDYDYESIMHYVAYSFAIDKKIPTIIPKKQNVTLGGRNLTELDILRINKMYGC